MGHDLCQGRAEGRFDFLFFSGQYGPGNIFKFPDADCGGFGEKDFFHDILLFRPAENSDFPSGTVFLHENRSIVHIQCSGIHQLFQGVSQNFSGAVVQIGFQLDDGVLIRRFRLFDQHGPKNIGSFLIVSLACAEPGLYDPEGCRQSAVRTERRRNGRTGRGYIFASGSGNLQGNVISADNVHHRRYRHGKNAVLAADGPGPLVQGGDNHFGYAEAVEKNSRSNNIHNGVHGSHFMEMDFFQRLAVCLCFRFSDNGKDFPGQCPGGVGHICLVDDIQAVGQIPVLMVMMSAAVAMFMMMPAAAAAFLFVVMVMTAAAFAVFPAAAALRQFFSHFRLIYREESLLIAFQGQDTSLLRSRFFLMMVMSAMAFSVTFAASPFLMMMMSAVSFAVTSAASSFLMMVMSAVSFSVAPAVFSLLMMVMSAVSFAVASAAAFLFVVVPAVPFSVTPAAFSFPMMMVSAAALTVAPAAFPFFVMVVSAVTLTMAAAAFSFFRFRTVQVRHIMVVIFMICIQQDVKTAAVDARFLYSGDFDIKTGCGNRPERLFQCFPVCAQIQQGCRKHIAGNPGVGFQIEFLFHSYIFLSARRLICVAT